MAMAWREFKEVYEKAIGGHITKINLHDFYTNTHHDANFDDQIIEGHAIFNYIPEYYIPKLDIFPELYVPNPTLNDKASIARYIQNTVLHRNSDTTCHKTDIFYLHDGFPLHYHYMNMIAVPITYSTDTVECVAETIIIGDNIHTHAVHIDHKGKKFTKYSFSWIPPVKKGQEFGCWTFRKIPDLPFMDKYHTPEGYQIMINI